MRLSAPRWAICRRLRVSRSSALAIFAIVTRLLGVAFARGLAQTADAPSGGRVRASRRLFRTGPGPALRRKEWRLLRRDPWLASQMLLQAAYTVPLCFVLWRTLGPEQGPVAAIGPADRGDRGAGGRRTRLDHAFDRRRAGISAHRAARRRRLSPAQNSSAVAIPLVVVLGVPLAVMALAAPVAAVATSAFAAAAACSTALLNLWRPAPGKRGDVLRRSGQPKLVGILEHLLALVWAVAASLFFADSLLFLAAAAFALVVLLATRRI